ncbi:MAG: HEAT repeat domain-containing protein [Anaerolineales bacterium]
MSEDLSTLYQWLREEDFRSILEFARKKKRVLSLLTALTYDKDQVICNRAIKATGLAAKVIAARDAGYIRNYLLRLFWLVNDESGGIGWRAPELIGEILFHCPNFDQFVPMLISLLDLEREDAPRFRVGTLRAIGRVAQVASDKMQPALTQVQEYTLPGEDEDTKQMAVWCMEQINAQTYFSKSAK